MPGEKKIDVVRRAWEIRVERGLDAALSEVWAEECVFEDPPGYPEPRIHTGRGGVRGASDRMSEFWDEFTIEPIEIVESGESVVVIGWIRGRGRGSGFPVKVEIAYVYEVEDGKIRRCRTFTSSEDAMAAAASA